MCDVKLGLQIQLDGNFLSAIFRLPPGSLVSSKTIQRWYDKTLALVIENTRRHAKSDWEYPGYIRLMTFSILWLKVGKRLCCGLESHLKHFFLSSKWDTMQYLSYIYSQKQIINHTTEMWQITSCEHSLKKVHEPQPSSHTLRLLWAYPPFQSASCPCSGNKSLDHKDVLAECTLKHHPPPFQTFIFSILQVFHECSNDRLQEAIYEAVK